MKAASTGSAAAGLPLPLRLTTLPPFGTACPPTDGAALASAGAGGGSTHTLPSAAALNIFSIQRQQLEVDRGPAEGC